jgi:hypothetical protein
MSNARKKIFQVLIKGFIPTTTVILGTSKYTYEKRYRSALIMNDISPEEMNEHKSRKNHHAHLIIQAAFKDAGYKGLVYLEINDTNSIIMGTASISKRKRCSLC